VGQVEEEFDSSLPIQATADWPSPGLLHLSASVASGTGAARHAPRLELVPFDWRTDLREVLQALEPRRNGGVSVYLDFDCPFNALLDPRLPSSPLAAVICADGGEFEQYLSLRRTAGAGLREGSLPDVPELLRALARLTG
jgi:hypothetical protein